MGTSPNFARETGRRPEEPARKIDVHCAATIFVFLICIELGLLASYAHYRAELGLGISANRLNNGDDAKMHLEKALEVFADGSEALAALGPCGSSNEENILRVLRLSKRQSNSVRLMSFPGITWELHFTICTVMKKPQHTSRIYPPGPKI